MATLNNVTINNATSNIAALNTTKFYLYNREQGESTRVE